MDKTKAPRAPGYMETPRYTQEDWDEVSDNPEWTAEERGAAKSFADVFPDLAKKIAQKKVATSIRLDADVIAHWRATGPGWQTRMNEALRKALIRTGGTKKRVKAKPPIRRAKSA
jgi:uncharacterized protein (DUF4415 family)